MLPTFRNEPFTDFSKPENEAAFRAALDQARAEAGRTYPLIIGGEQLTLQDTFASINPARPAEAIGHFANGTAAHVDQAVKAATAAFQTWQFTPVEERVRYLLRAAAAMRRRRHEFSALMVLEVGKSWYEADLDTSEAIDFMEYYARQLLRVQDSSHLLYPYQGEQMTFEYIALGVGAVISPWNFPNAIAMGMVSASLAAGNTVVFKPAEQSPAIGYKLCELFWEQGIPDGVLNYLTGPGEVVGAAMVDHPGTRFIAFTGSKDVGIQIYEHAAKVHKGQRWLKRSILEMGGKDPVVVDETAGIEEAAQGIVAGAFTFQGQKCSCGSRAIMVNDLYDRVTNRVVELASKLTVGDPSEGPHIYMGPVIDQDSFNKVNYYMEVGTQEGKLLLGGQPIKTDSGGYFIPPTIFGDVPANGRVAMEEIFGPVLTLVRTDNWQRGIEIANSTEYGLTGAFFSNNRDRVEYARRTFHVGNLYINRKCTGAFVGVQPFGGFNMSGTDTKAGGPDYLYQFMQAKTIAERL
ncbi:MAG: L-glutamate gamma-semialdehyde dehydrogenase [Anaerolineae bacterium]